MIPHLDELSKAAELIGAVNTVRRDGDRLFVKVSGNMPEGPLVARSETRFGLPWPESTIEFQLDGQGKVTGAILEQQGPQGIQRVRLDRQ